MPKTYSKLTKAPFRYRYNQTLSDL